MLVIGMSGLVAGLLLPTAVRRQPHRMALT